MYFFGDFVRVSNFLFVRKRFETFNNRNTRPRSGRILDIKWTFKPPIGSILEKDADFGLTSHNGRFAGTQFPDLLQKTE